MGADEWSEVLAIQQHEANPLSGQGRHLRYTPGVNLASRGWPRFKYNTKYVQYFINPA